MPASDPAVVLRRRAAFEQAIRQRHQEAQDTEGLRALSISALTARRIQLAHDFKSFKHYHLLVCDITDDGTEQAQYERREEVYRLYFEAKAKLTEQIGEQPPVVMALNDSLSSQTIRVETARPPEPGEFNGNPSEWPAFRDRFKAEVHEKDMDNVTKLIYLQKACVGQAKETLGHWQPIAINYAKAWASLEQKFNDPYRLEQSLVKDIMRMPRATEETHSSLRKVIDVTANTVRQLEAMGVPVNQWDSMLINILVHRLPRTTADAWEQRRDVDKKPTLQELMTFLEAKARGRIYTDSQSTRARPYDRTQVQERSNERSGGQGYRHERNQNRYRRNGGHHDGQRRENDGYNNRRYNNEQKPAIEQSGQSSRPAGSGVQCYQCKQQHPLYRCEEFLKKTIEERSALVQSWSICANCLRAHAGECYASECFRCNKMHNSVLCPKRERKMVPAGAYVRRDNGPRNQRSY